MPVRTIEDLAQDVVDTMLHTRHLTCQDEVEYFEYLDQVLSNLLRIVAGHLPQSAFNSCIRDVTDNIQIARRRDRLRMGLEQTLQQELQGNG